MCKFIQFFKSNIGLKFCMAVSGTLLCLFLLVHMAGNLLILADAQVFNDYAYALTKNKILLYVAEAGLLGIVGLHIVAAVVLARRNRAARPQAYQVKTNSGLSRRNWFSSNMIITGGFVVFFLVYHINHFKFGPEYQTVQNGVPMRDLARLVEHEFTEAYEVILYVVAMLVIAFHLFHGVRSLFATFGAESGKSMRLIQAISYSFVVLVMGGFILIPLTIFLSAGQ